ncbi:MAG TPA: hypothetical protein VD815_00030 [Candidatus Saccharimonadales bacterium]|nr:hypothetical protein [Candidatus Saccharimonadales bacterium]
MNTKEFVTKIIKTNQIFQRARSLPKLLSVGFISTLGLLPLASIPNRGVGAYAQQVQLQTTADPWYQSLETARSKVEAALSPEAYGHGVPGLQNLSTNEILMAIGISIMASILVFMTVRMWLSRPRHVGKKGSIMSYQK